MKQNLIRFAFIAAGAAVLAGGALAQSRDAPALRATLTVGEQSDGLMACVSTCDAQTLRDIEAINAQRRRLYEQDVEAASAAAAGAASYMNRLNCTGIPAKNCIQKGQYHRQVGGPWTRK
jgi:uncharacterized protein YdbL (DUF1318 family)